jgi:hypothetical protein
MSLAVIIISCVIAVTLVGHVLVRKFVKDEDLDTHLPAVEAMLGVVGTLFSVLLGLLVAGAIDNYQDVRHEVINEANGLGDVFRLARGLGTEDRPRIRKLCRDYAKIVVDEEWEEMRDGKMSSHAWAVYTELWEAAVAVYPTEDRQNNLHQALLNAMQSFGENRRSRAVACTTRLSDALWATIIFGSLTITAFTFFFTAKFGRFHVVLTTLIAGSLGLNIWLLAAYSEPFSGEMQISPDMFKLLENQVFNTPDTPSRFLHPPTVK